MNRTPILLLSPRYQREARANLEQVGRDVRIVAANEDPVRVYRNASAFIAIVDARGALELGLEHTRALSSLVLERRGGLLVLLSRNDAKALPRVFDAGATHYLISPFGPEQLHTALRFVERAIQRMRASGADAAVADIQTQLRRSPRWRWERGDTDLWVSLELAELLGLPTATSRVPLKDLKSFLSAADMLRIRNQLRPLLSARVSGSIDHRMDILGEPHRFIHHVQLLMDEAGETCAVAATIEDVTEAAKQQRVSLHYDALTGLANLNNVRVRLDDILRDGREGGGPAAIAVLIGISRLDQINAAHGREFADNLIQAVARRLKRLVEERNLTQVIAARLGGAEFAIVFSAPTTLNQAVFFSQLAAKIFDRPFIVEGKAIHLACRIGIAPSEPAMQAADELLHIASSALAAAKELGPNAFQVYLSEHEDDAVRLANLEQTVRDVSRARQLDIRYQPQVDVATNAIAGVEALVRMEHPIYGTLPAETLLATAERGEFGIEFGRNIMRQACAEATQWPEEMAKVRLSVNVTAADMRDPEFVSGLVDILEETGFPSNRLTLEITEGGLVEDLARTAGMLDVLKERRICVAIDDFGTGYSSLAYLKSLPLDFLKIDKTIAADIVGESRDKIIVRGVVDMARSLDMTVIAEGVETEAQLELLIREGCNWYQGFLCAGALSSSELPQFFRQWAGGRSAREAVHA
ncbi:putative bifunctional diguanylate cyclase/phosphodiesterase [Pacificimonas flava]|uniref:Diguanylate cyclase/phosphodiesterase n=1 Tax=Pacificimonas flava TaxID=1234595 RepID=M2U8I5_9SPHN|nr:bifunctional diguanylate cyclase/phosphodiesterase [Pacificimonas flava]EMD84293.1 diguanylate cyclase/phosphodiesterase [Pacificimonas flava]MBB5279831.1 diguanylate cyclase (GGDEF)-like protein [Pacificimonas flava]